MINKVLADLIVMIHFGWILFILIGFLLTLVGFFYIYVFHTSLERWEKFFDRWIFRTIHLCGIVYVGLLAVLGKYCPLTILEYTLRSKYNPEFKYPGSFIVHYIEKLVYPEVSLLIILIPTIVVALFTILAYIIRPPAKIRRLFE